MRYLMLSNLHGAPGAGERGCIRAALHGMREGACGTCAPLQALQGALGRPEQDHGMDLRSSGCGMSLVRVQLVNAANLAESYMQQCTQMEAGHLRGAQRAGCRC